jgi:hypothetical protein
LLLDSSVLQNAISSHNAAINVYPRTDRKEATAVAVVRWGFRL